MSKECGGLAAGAALACAGAAALLAESRAERRSLTAAVYTLRSKKLKKADRTLVFLSDLHDCRFGERQRRLLSAIARLRPHAVLIGGDMMTVKRSAAIQETLFLCGALSRRWPVFYAEGNHEARLDRDRGRYGALYDELRAGLDAAGVCFLRDRSALLDEDIRVSGLSIGENYYAKFCREKMRAAYLEERLGPADGERFQLLLAHTPAFHAAYADWGADLTLAGHFHGGTICLPGGIGLMTPQLAFFQRNVRGMHLLGRSAMIVSPGLGTHSVNLRINNRPQLVAVRLQSRGEA